MANEYWLANRKKKPQTRFMASLSYMGVLCLVPMLFNRRDEFIHFHARQGLVLWIWGVISIFSLHIPVVGGFFFSFSVFVITVLSLLGILSVMLTRKWRLPVISILTKWL
ncbi:MAG: hypothetical protein H7832_10010 [Magnetococcus sp. DMHC-6]